MARQDKEVGEDKEVDEDFEEIEQGDYIFVIDVYGNLKSYALPENLEDDDELPDSIEQIMKIFKRQRSFVQQTIH